MLCQFHGIICITNLVPRRGSLSATVDLKYELIKFGDVWKSVYIFQGFPKDRFPLRRQLNTVRDLATFVAKAACWPQPRQALTNGFWTTTTSSKLEDLASMNRLRQMEPRFVQKAVELTSKLHLLDRLPLVLTHIDFAEVNLKVDPSDGHLTGVLNFDGARVEALGMCLFGVYESFFGEMRDARWRFFDQPTIQDSQEPGHPPRSVRETLQAAFWDTLWDAMPPGMTRQDLEEPGRIEGRDH